MCEYQAVLHNHNCGYIRHRDIIIYILVNHGFDENLYEYLSYEMLSYHTFLF